MKGVLPISQLNTKEASVNQESGTFTSTNILLWKFAFDPKMTSKRLRTTFNALTFAQLFSPNNRVSWANWRWEICALWPCPHHASTIDLIMTFNPSTKFKKRKGERGSPRLKPLSKQNSSIRQPFIGTKVVVVVTLHNPLPPQN